jgi:Uma2 family endonuclease
MALLVAPKATELEDVSSYLWRVNVERYHEMIETGLITKDDHLELLEGFLVEKMSIKPLHTFVIETVRETLAAVTPDSFFVNAQQPITTADSEPEPDVLIIRGRRQDFLDHHPGPESVALLVEVSDSTLYQDQTWKKRIYARAGVSVYWIINLPERQIEVYTQPSGPTANPAYRQLFTYRDGDHIPLFLDEKEIASLPLSDLLPPA